MMAPCMVNPGGSPGSRVSPKGRPAIQESPSTGLTKWNLRCLSILPNSWETLEDNVIPSVIRLQTLDDCLGSGVNAPDFMKPARTSGKPSFVRFDVAPWVTKDGELRTVEVTTETYILNRQLTSQVVQRGPDVVKAIPKDSTQPQRELSVNVDSEYPVIFTPPLWSNLWEK